MIKISFGQLMKCVWIALTKNRILKNAQSLPTPSTQNDDEQNARYIVSFTSYGKRLKTCAPYAAASLLNQTVKPDKIILWISEDDRKNVTRKLEQLQERGLEIRECVNLRSHTKLIPALFAFPNDFITTADDDIFYPKNWFEQIIDTHKKHPRKIICHRVHGIKVDKDHAPITYSEWDKGFKQTAQNDNNPQARWQAIFPTGVGGILYPPNCFHKDITNKDLFMTLSPCADDIWFWAMAVINKEYRGDESPYVLIENSCMEKMLYVDMLEQIAGSPLWQYNRSQGGNDVQLKAVIENYPQLKEVLCMIEPSV